MSSSKSKDTTEKSLTKPQMISALALKCGLNRKQVEQVLDELFQLMIAELKRRQSFVFSGMIKMLVVKKAAKPEREGVNPFTGEKIKFKAKPSTQVVKMRALKRLKEMVNQAENS